MPTPDGTSFANFLRNKVTVPKETTSFSPTMGDNHDGRYWGTLRLVGPGR